MEKHLSSLLSEGFRGDTTAHRLPQPTQRKLATSDVGVDNAALSTMEPQGCPRCYPLGIGGHDALMPEMSALTWS